MPRLGVEPIPRRARLLAAGLAILAASGGEGCAADDPNPYFGSAQRPPKDIGTFYSNTTGEPEYLDPGKAADAASTSLIGQLFEGLTSLDPRDTHPVQGVAESFEQSAD